MTYKGPERRHRERFRERVLHIAPWYIAAVVTISGVVGWAENRSRIGDIRDVVRTNCETSNAIKREQAVFNRGFYWHNRVTWELFAQVGDSLGASDPRTAELFHRFVRSYQLIEHGLRPVYAVDCERLVENGKVVRSLIYDPRHPGHLGGHSPHP